MVKLIPVFALLLILSGCMTVKLPDQTEVTLYGRGCIDMIQYGDGKYWITTQQDGESNWIIGRVAAPVVHELVGIAALVVGSPAEIFRALLGMPSPPPAPGPSNMHGCSSVLGDGEIPTTPEPERKSLFGRFMDAIRR